MSAFFHYTLPVELNARRLLTGSFLFGGSGSGVRHALGVSVTILVCVVLAIAIVLAASRGGRWFAVRGRSRGLSGALCRTARHVVLEQWPVRRLSGTAHRSSRCSRLRGSLLSFWAPSSSRHQGNDGRCLERRTRRSNGSVPLRLGRRQPNHGQPARIRFGEIPMRQPTEPSASCGRTGYGTDSPTLGWRYKLDLLSGQMLTITPAKGDVDRQPAFARTVALSQQQAWLFVPPSQMSSAYAQFFTTIPSHDTITESRFLTALRILHVGYSEVNAGVLSAVVPDRHITIAEVAAVPANT